MKQDINVYMQELGIKARKAAAVLTAVESKIKNDALTTIADKLIEQTELLKAENARFRSG